MALPNPVIVIPGITASYLEDRYPISPEIIWGFSWRLPKMDYQRATLHPTDPQYELREPARVVAGQLYEVVYKDLIDSLRYELSPNEDTPVPVFPFPYDWRHPLEQTQEALGAFIHEVIARTRLLPHYNAAGYTKDNGQVTLVGHSMGGLIIAGYLSQHKKRQDHRVGKVITLGSPFRGSLEAVVKLTTGLAELGAKVPSASEREAARLTPALYYLLPSFRGAVETVDDDVLSNLYNADTWQPSVARTLEAFIEKYGLPPKNPPRDAQFLLAAMLDRANAHRRKLEDFRLESAELSEHDWLCVAGTGVETRTSILITRDTKGQPFFDVRSLALQNTPPHTGDGTVPLFGAMNSFISPNRVVCVTPDDFERTELWDHGLAKKEGLHGFLPTMNMLHRLIVRFIKGAPDPYGGTWGRPLPGLDPERDGPWSPPLTGGLENKGMEEVGSTDAIFAKMMPTKKQYND